MTDTEDALRGALARLLDGLPPRQAARAVERLIAGYRGDGAPELRDRADVAAYAAYRMPATFQAVRAALHALRAAAPAWRPGSHTDVGGGTGAAVWAAADAWPSGGRRTTVLDRAGPALELGRELADGTLDEAGWTRRVLGTDLELPASDLVTVSYVLGELGEADRRGVVRAAAAAGRAVVVVEPGTPEGYLRIMEARDALIAAGLTVAAPCPHSGACPIERGADWCHFAARVQRSALHRRVKGGELGHEDEKYAYVAAARFPVEPAANRVVRHPLLRKGLVLLDLCEPGGRLTRTTVSKRQGPRYKAARDTAWGDAWPPHG